MAFVVGIVTGAVLGHFFGAVAIAKVKEVFVTLKGKF